VWNFQAPQYSILGGLQLLTDRYQVKVPMWITETGMSQMNEPALSMDKKVNDMPR